MAAKLLIYRLCPRVLQEPYYKFFCDVVWAPMQSEIFFEF